jgi:hypothetical protein
MKEIKLNVNNNFNGKNIKEKLAQIENKNLNEFKCRLFFKGQEIQDQHKLFYHNLENNSKLQVIFNKLNS